MSVQVSVYSGSGSVKVLSFSGTKWSELQSTLSANNIAYNSGSMKAVIGETELTLESPDSIVPSTDFTLFLLPQKVKSGYEESYDESYDDNVGAELSAPLSADPSTWTKEQCIAKINEAIQKNQENSILLGKIANYLTNLAVSPMDNKAKELINKLFS